MGVCVLYRLILIKLPSLSSPRLLILSLPIATCHLRHSGSVHVFLFPFALTHCIWTMSSSMQHHPDALPRSTSSNSHRSSSSGGPTEPTLTLSGESPRFTGDLLVRPLEPLIPRHITQHLSLPSPRAG